MALQYRPWREGDDLELLQMWGAPDGPQAEQARSLLRPASEDPWSRCIVAEDDGVPVAAGCVFEAKLHSERLWAYIEVAADHRRSGLGSTLLTMLRHEAANSPSAVTTLRAKVNPETSGAEFAAAVGLLPIQRSRIVTILPGALAVPDFEDPKGPQLEEAATGSVELTRTVVDWYNAVHSWDPADMTLGQAQQYLLADLTGASGAVVLRDRPKGDGGAIAAFAISYTQTRTDGPADVLLGCNTALPESEQDAALATLLAMLVHEYPVQLELDDSMTALCRILEPLLGAGSARQDELETLVVSD